MNTVIKNNLEVIPILGDYYKDASYIGKEGIRSLYKITEDSIEIVGFTDDVSTIECDKLDLKNVYIKESHLKGEGIEVFNSFIEDSHITCEELTLNIQNSFIQRSSLKGRFVNINECRLERVKEYKYDLDLYYAEKYDIKS